MKFVAAQKAFHGGAIMCRGLKVARADVLHLLNPALTQRRVEVTGDRRSMAIRRLLLRNGHSLDFWKKLDVQRFLDAHPALREVYLAKEAIHRLYRTRGIDRPTRALGKLLERLAACALPEFATLRRSLTRWRAEVHRASADHSAFKGRPIR